MWKKFAAPELSHLVELLNELGYELIGPKVADGAIVYGTLTDVDQLPRGIAEQQSPGSYRLVQRADDALFGYQVGPQTWRRYLQPPQETLWKAKRTEKSFEIIATDTEQPENTKPLAFFGVRSCDLHAIAELDKVYMNGPFPDPHYVARRENLLVIAVNCTESGNNCFCHDTNTGPTVDQYFDLVLNEVLMDKEHFFMLNSGSAQGASIVQTLTQRGTVRNTNERERQMVEDGAARAVSQMKRSLKTADLKETLYNQLEHPHWDEIAERCLSCANCTLTCPTCFCTEVDDVTDLSNSETIHTRRWDSCFNSGHSHLSEINLRQSTKDRYRQWLTHKFATWYAQFDSLGCVGCGRCISWCPVGIDVLEEIAFFQSVNEAQAAGTEQ